MLQAVNVRPCTRYLFHLTNVDIVAQFNYNDYKYYFSHTVSRCENAKILY